MAFTPRTVSRLCSMSKQFTCGLVLNALGTLNFLDAALAHRLRYFEERLPRVVHLCHNPSGFRDYWVLAMLLGASSTSPFGDVEVGRLLDGMRTLQFDPRTQFSYMSLNFRLLGDLLADRLGRRLSDLTRMHLFDRYGMESAICAFDTRAMPDGTEGYRRYAGHRFQACRE
ncbi:MAG: serine hydrolase [Gluconobacter oxydans]